MRAPVCMLLCQGHELVCMEGLRMQCMPAGPRPPCDRMHSAQSAAAGTGALTQPRSVAYAARTYDRPKIVFSVPHCSAPSSPRRSSVLARIEGLISDAVAAVAHGQLPELQLVSTAAGNTHMVADGGGGGGDGGGDAGFDEDLGPAGSDSRGAAAPAQPSAVDYMRLEDEGDEDGGGGSGEEGADGRQQRERRRRRRRAHGASGRLRLGSLTQVKSITHGQGRQAHGVARGKPAAHIAPMQQRP
jgi:hypothetical protein